MKIGLVRESPTESMVALTPDGVNRLTAMDCSVTVQVGAGVKAGFSDQSYAAQGAVIVEDVTSILAGVDLVATVHGADGEDWSAARPGTVLIGLLKPLSAPLEGLEQLARAGITALSLDALPRISRAQSMDVLSSLSTVGGYRAVILAAERLRKFFPLLMTAAGTIAPARVLVLGCGVAGLQAIATAHRLGAIVEAFDTRPEVKEQVESLGATFLTVGVMSAATQDGYGSQLDREAHRQELLSLQDPVARADVIVCTAQIPGQRAPILVTREMMAAMAPGSVIVDLAAEGGGNTEVTKAGQEVDLGGVLVLGPEHIASQIPGAASQLYSRNLSNFIALLVQQGIGWDPDHAVELPDDEVVTRTTITHRGTIVHPGVLTRIQQRGVLDVSHS